MPTYPLINCVIDFAIDGVVMAHQPFIVALDGAEAEMVVTARGYVLPAIRAGRHVRITWGEGVATEAAVAEIRTALGTTLEHTFTWTDPDLTAQSIDVGIEGYETQWSWDKPGYYEPVTVEAWERAPARVIAPVLSGALAVAHVFSPRVMAWPWTPGVGFGVKYADPATLPTGSGSGVAFTGTSDIAVANTISFPFVSTYPWTTGAGFGVKYANPATLPPGTVFDVKFA